MKYKNNKNKIISSILSVALVSFFATSCGSNNDTPQEGVSKNETTETTRLEEEYSNVVPITLGEPIVTDTREIIVNSIEFTEDIKPEHKNFDYYMKQRRIRNIVADPGNIFINADVDVKNLEKQNVKADQILTMVVDYNDGYIYNSMPFVESEPAYISEYASTVDIVPLATERIQYGAECPEEVETSNNTVIVYLIMDDIYYYYYLVD